MKRAIFGAALALLMSACGSDAELETVPTDEPELQGLYITDETGLIIDTWRSPDGGNGIHIYPNPTNGRITIQLGEDGQKSSIWWGTSRLPEEIESRYFSDRGKTLEDLNIRFLHSDPVHEFRWELPNKGTMPPGFYRISVEYNGAEYHRDFYFGGEGALHSDMVNYLYSLD